MFIIKDNLLKISVRNLVEFICRDGDIDNRFKGLTDKTAMDAGSKAHKKIQKAMGPDYKSEVSLSVLMPEELFDIQVEGRADGIFVNDEITYIDEIKGTYKDIRYLSAPVSVHKAQAMCYGYIYASENNLDRIGIRMTYVNLDNENIKYFEEVILFEKLEEWFLGIIKELEKWGRFLLEHKLSRNKSIEDLSFPFEYRKGQRELAACVYNNIKNNTNLFIEAPTGVGKTISTVFPAIKAIANSLGDRIFYLTAKTITRTAAEDTFKLLVDGGLDFKSVTITAKDKICFSLIDGKSNCNPVTCINAKGHFDRVNDAIYDMVKNEKLISRQTIEKYAEKYMVCPYELSLDAAYFTDGLICDYNYAFDPEVSLKRFFSDGNKGDYVFLIDEAHNLVDRARDMYSAKLYKDKFLEIKHLVAPYSKRLSNAIEAVNKALLEFKRECHEESLILDLDDSLSLKMLRLEKELTTFMENNRDFPEMNPLSLFFFDVIHFNRMHELSDRNYVKFCEHTSDGFVYKLFCVNPAANLSAIINKGRNAIFFSATLLPVNYYKELLTGKIEDNAVYADSSFDINKRLLLVGKDVTSRYTRRNVDEYTKIKEYINFIVTAKKGNYIIFFPSYKYLEEVYELFDYSESFDIIKQKNIMSEEEKESFLNKFDAGNEKSLAAFCVLGGSFSEGIDLKNDRLIGTVIVGTGLPSINTECDILKDYYNYDYAYVYPGMNKVLQAAGRVIRTENDTGVVILLDDRFLTSRYLNMFPKEWSNYKSVTLNQAKEEILDFWNDMNYNVSESACMNGSDKG